MSAERENGRPSAEAVESPVVPTPRASATPNTYPNNNYPRPRGATPLFDTVEVVDARDWMTEPADMGDALALDTAILAAVPNYRARWFAYLGTPDGAA